MDYQEVISIFFNFFLMNTVALDMHTMVLLLPAYSSYLIRLVVSCISFVLAGRQSHFPSSQSVKRTSPCIFYLQVPSSKSPFNEIMLSFPMRKAAASYLEGRKRGFSNRLSCICLFPTHRQPRYKERSL